MSSLLTNSTAMSALQTLKATNANMATTQDRISSGLRVGSAKDNAAYWSIATTMRSDTGAISAVEDALGIGAAKVDTAYVAVKASIDIVDKIKAKYVAAKEGALDKETIQKDISDLTAQLKNTAKSASFAGENLVNRAASENIIVVDGFVRNSDGTIEVSKNQYTTSATNVLFEDADGTDAATAGGLLGEVAFIADLTTGMADADIDAAITTVETALKGLNALGSQFGSMQTRIELQTDFAGKLGDALTKGIGRLVDADMNEESTRLKALQTQQQLGIQALSIANSESQNILSLFR